LSLTVRKIEVSVRRDHSAPESPLSLVRAGARSAKATASTAPDLHRRTRFSGCDLIFFDPDNGLEIGSRPPGRKHSCKHLYWNEVCETFLAGSSVLIYQHFIREKRSDYAARIVRELSSRTGAAAVFSFSTPHVLFVLAAQGRHADSFRQRLPVIRDEWKSHITVFEHEPEILPGARDSKPDS
jgi:hypothetical protein